MYSKCFMNVKVSLTIAYSVPRLKLLIPFPTLTDATITPVALVAMLLLEEANCQPISRVTQTADGSKSTRTKHEAGVLHNGIGLQPPEVLHWSVGTGCA